MKLSSHVASKNYVETTWAGYYKYKGTHISHVTKKKYSDVSYMDCGLVLRYEDKFLEGN